MRYTVEATSINDFHKMRSWSKGRASAIVTPSRAHNTQVVTFSVSYTHVPLQGWAAFVALNNNTALFCALFLFEYHLKFSSIWIIFQIKLCSNKRQVFFFLVMIWLHILVLAVVFLARQELVQSLRTYWTLDYYQVSISAKNTDCRTSCAKNKTKRNKTKITTVKKE